VSDAKEFETSLDLVPDITPSIAITCKGYDSRSNRAAVQARRITPVIPRKVDSKKRRALLSEAALQVAGAN